jgi:hypothetical protein
LFKNHPRYAARSAGTENGARVKVTAGHLGWADLTFVRSDHPKAQTPEFFTAIAQTGRPIYALNYWWEGHGQEGGPGRGEGRPTLPGTWTQLVTLWGDELHVWQWTPAPISPASGK